MPDYVWKYTTNVFVDFLKTSVMCKNYVEVNQDCNID